MIWGQELATSLKHTAGLLEEDCEEELSKSDKKARTFGLRLKDALSGIWKDATTDVFESRYALSLNFAIMISLSTKPHAR